MCGIAGALDLRRNAMPDLDARLHAMNELQAHRGPDGQGLWIHPDRHLGFGHRRLSIIDIDGGAQPMRDEAGNCLTYNGEIYNYLELRDQLGAESFVTDSDTEVILKAYRSAGGVDCVDHLRGMFAFAIWDEARGRASSAPATGSASSPSTGRHVGRHASTSPPRSRPSSPSCRACRDRPPRGSRST